MRSTSSRLTALACALALTGCLTYAPLQRGADPVDLDDGSVAMLTVRFATEIDGDLPPLTNAFVSEGGDGWVKNHAIKLAPPYLETESADEYLVSFQLPPGEYFLTGLLGQSFGWFFTVLYSYDIPVRATVKLPERSFVYLGHFDVRIVAAPAGSGRGIAVRVVDRQDEDVALARSLYGLPASADVLNQTPRPRKRR